MTCTSQLHVRDDLTELMHKLNESKYQFMRDRISRLWPEWRAAAKRLEQQKQSFGNRQRKNVCLTNKVRPSSARFKEMFHSHICFLFIWLFLTTFFEFINNNNNNNTVEPPVSDHPKCKDWVVAYGRWSFTRTEPRGVSSEKKSRLIFFMEDNLLHALSKLGYQWSSMLSRKFLVYSN